MTAVDGSHHCLFADLQALDSERHEVLANERHT